MTAYRMSVCGCLTMSNLRSLKPVEAITPQEVGERKERQYIIKVVSKLVFFSPLKV